MLYRGTISVGDRATTGRARSLWRESPRRIRMRGTQQRLVWSHHAGARARRFGRQVLRLRAGCARDVSDLRIWERTAKKRVSTEDGERRNHRLLWIDRSRLRIESIGNDHARARTTRWNLDLERRKDVDHERIDVAGRGCVGKDRRFERRQLDSRIHRSE